MKNLIDVSNTNIGKKSIFSEIIILDWYDGPIRAVCKVISIDKWEIASLVYFDPNLKLRIFSLVEMPLDWLNKFETEFNMFKKNNYENYNVITKAIRMYSKNYDGVVFLFKCDDLSSIKYEIVQIDSNKLKFFESVKSVLSQNEQSQKRWLNFFHAY